MPFHRQQKQLSDILHRRRKLILVVTLTGLLAGIGYYYKENLISSIEYFTQLHVLLNITNFRYIHNPGNVCSVRFKEGRNSILTIVKSTRTNFIARHIIRRTYGAVHTYDGWDIQVIFSVGMAPPKENQMVEGLLHREADKYGDIIMGNFIDTYRNLSYKHLMGYKWAIEYCPQATYFIKADDDVTVDIFHAIEFLKKTPSMIKDYYCVLYSGTSPIFNERSKWEVTREEYNGQYYPEYCGFAAYVVGFGTLKRVLAVSHEEKYLFIDDVFVTGMLREHVNREEKIPENKINFVNSRAWSLGDTNYVGLNKTILTKTIFNVIDESRSPSRSCWVWDLMLKTHELSHMYASTCNTL